MNAKLATIAVALPAVSPGVKGLEQSRRAIAW
jgi:hypothetical protein